MRKALVTIIIVFILAILCLAFVGIFGRLPDEWELITIILAVAGIALGTPSMFQIFWGRACVETEFVVSAKDSERSLIILLKNPPVKSKVLKAFGVKRETVQSLTANIRISEFGSKKIIVPIRHARLFSDDDSGNTGSNRIVLPQTYSVAASMMVAMWDNNKKQAVILGDAIREHMLLGEGYYWIQIIIIVDGQPKEISQGFVVGKNADDLIWTKPN